MEAGILKRAWLADSLRSIFLAAGISLLAWASGSGPVLAASYRTQNFVVTADTSQLARSVGDSAEKYRRDLANYWTGRHLPPWPAPCPIRVLSGANLAAQGMTQYDRAPVRNFVMEVVGTEERILDSVLPHEVTHTVLATHFGRPLPRWADEGICTTVEHQAERSKHDQMLREFLSTKRGIPMNRLFLLTEYPGDVLPMYAQGYSVCRFFIAQKGPRQFIEFLHDYMRRPSWTENVRKHYGYESLGKLQEKWLAWVANGSGPVDQYAITAPSSPTGGRQASSPTQLAAVSASTSELANAPVERSAVVGTALAGLADSPATLALANAEPRLHANGAGSGGEVSTTAETRTPGLRPVPRSMIPPSIVNSGRYSVAQPQHGTGITPTPNTKPAPTTPRWAGRSRQWR